MTAPKRIQMSRQHPWQTKPKAVIVARPSRWGNPFKVGDTVRVLDATTTIIETGQPKRILVRDRAHAVELYRAAIAGHIWVPAAYPHERTQGEIQRLRGKDLACWCPLDQPCHADVLLELANGVTS